MRSNESSILINFYLINTERLDFVEGWTSVSAPALQTSVHNTSVNGRDLYPRPLPNRLNQGCLSMAALFFSGISKMVEVINVEAFNFQKTSLWLIVTA